MCIVVLFTILALAVAITIWVYPLPVPDRYLDRHRIMPGAAQGNRGELQGVLTVQHTRRIAANRNSDTHYDTLSVYLNHREVQDLHSSE